MRIENTFDILIKSMEQSYELGRIQQLSDLISETES